MCDNHNDWTNTPDGRDDFASGQKDPSSDWGMFEEQDVASHHVSRSRKKRKTSRGNGGHDDDGGDGNNMDDKEDGEVDHVSAAFEAVEAKRNPGETLLLQRLCSAATTKALSDLVTRIRLSGWRTDLVAAVLHYVRLGDTDRVVTITSACSLDKFGVEPQNTLRSELDQLTSALTDRKWSLASVGGIVYRWLLTDERLFASITARQALRVTVEQTDDTLLSNLLALDTTKAISVFFSPFSPTTNAEERVDFAVQQSVWNRAVLLAQESYSATRRNDKPLYVLNHYLSPVFPAHTPISTYQILLLREKKVRTPDAFWMCSYVVQWFMKKDLASFLADFFHRTRAYEDQPLALAKLLHAGIVPACPLHRGCRYLIYCYWASLVGHVCTVTSLSIADVGKMVVAYMGFNLGVCLFPPCSVCSELEYGKVPKQWRQELQTIIENGGRDTKTGFGIVNLNYSVSESQRYDEWIQQL